MATPRKQAKNVEKIVIRPYLDPKQKKSAGADFTIPINPEGYAQSFKIGLDEKSTGGNQGSAPEYKFTAPEQLKLDFTLDNTGTIEGNVLDGTEVKDQVKQLLDTTYYMRSDAHKPAILKIQWGLFTFDCILATLDINYVLFKPNGDPLRAKVSASFTQYVEPKKRVATEDKHSPDLYRSVRVADGDTLPLLTYKSYGDPALHAQVAWFNELVSVRALKTDQELVFPPVKQSGN
ncbi:hypothetical protein SAMN05518672_1039 [Chitinophaga sp. CF118]|uniref:CIS tube protein n=1 Tax=Chitinophaga sp. CF118 TaxID=1884367 RepID=UPI0008F2EAC8|nr:hypothetical protein [Chitinophaga sp. CF118]SFD73763.1 hypothetical protein SAMN05518672_1039 [Chitinophaga sp. CF118]